MKYLLYFYVVLWVLLAVPIWNLHVALNWVIVDMPAGLVSNWTSIPIGYSENYLLHIGRKLSFSGFLIECALPAIWLITWRFARRKERSLLPRLVYWPMTIICGIMFYLCLRAELIVVSNDFFSSKTYPLVAIAICGWWCLNTAPCGHAGHVRVDRSVNGV